MRLRALLALGAAALLVLTGCTAQPEPEPTGSATASASARPTPTPTPDPLVEPTAAFAVTCDDVAAVMTELMGQPDGEIVPALSVVSASSFTPGPMRYLFDRAQGIACSVGGAGEQGWEVSIVPGAEAVTTGAAARGGYDGPVARCEMGFCVFQIVDGDILLSARVTDSPFVEDDAARVQEALASVAAEAERTRTEVELPSSQIVGVECSRLLTAQELSDRLGEPVSLIERFGGWSIASEVYSVVNGSRICHYASNESEYESVGYVTITSLPGGAWRLAQTSTGTEVEVEGTDAALTDTDELGRPVLDVRIGTDWLRFTGTPDSAPTIDLAAIATQGVQNFTVGRPAPQ